MSPTGSSGPLVGVRVLELCHFLAGPYAGLILADLGADVVKVEDPDRPDEARSMGPFFQDRESLYFLALNWGKRSIGVRLGTPVGSDVVRDLAREADVVVANYRPGALERVGIGLDALRASNPRLVTCSLTAFGETGPDAPRPGYDYTIQALSGVMSLAGEPESPPAKAGISYVDHSGGMAAALAVTAALVERTRTGRGRHLDVSLLDVQTSMLTYLASWALNAGHVPCRTARSAHPSLTPAQNFRTADGWVSVFVGNDGMWRRMVEALDERSLRDARYDTREGRATHRDELLGVLQKVLLADTSAAWSKRLSEYGVACAPVNDVSAALAEPQVRFRELTDVASHPAYGAYSHAVGPLPQLSCRPSAGAPLLGEHTTGVLRSAGYTEARIEALAQDGVVVRP